MRLIFIVPFISLGVKVQVDVHIFLTGQNFSKDLNEVSSIEFIQMKNSLTLPVSYHVLFGIDNSENLTQVFSQEFFKS